jgi:hypothetical protein
MDEYEENTYVQNYICSPDTPENSTDCTQSFIIRYEGILVEMRISYR